MSNDYLITIDGKHKTGDNIETVSLTTLGNYTKHDGMSCITYTETPATGFDGDVTTLTVEDGRRATLERTGKTNSKLIMEKGQKYMCHYDTGYGNIMIGIFADIIDNNLDHDGGQVRLRYTLDMNSNALSTNELNITVKENSPHA